jgi:hypothetical protein
MLRVITPTQMHDELGLDLDQLVREDAKRMLAVALEAEVDAYLAAMPPTGTRAADGWWSATATRGSARSPPRLARWRCGRRGWMTPHRSGERRAGQVSFGDLSPWCRKRPEVAEVLPLLSLHGLSTGDFVAAPEAFFGRRRGCRRR